MKTKIIKKIGIYTVAAVIGALIGLGIVYCASLVMKHRVDTGKNLSTYATYFSGDRYSVEKGSFDLGAFYSRKDPSVYYIHFRMWSWQDSIDAPALHKMTAVFAFPDNCSTDSVPQLDTLFLYDPQGECVTISACRMLTTLDESGYLMSCTMHYNIDDAWVYETMPDTIAHVGLRRTNGSMLVYPSKPEIASQLRILYEKLK